MTLLEIYNDFLLLSPANKANFIIGALGLIAAPSIAITRWLVRRMMAGEIAALHEEIDGLRSVSNSQATQIKVLEERNRAQAELVENVKMRTPDHVAERIVYEAKSGNDEIAAQSAWNFASGQASALSRIAYALGQHYAAFAVDDPQNARSAYRFSQIAALLDPNSRAAVRLADAVVETCAAQALSTKAPATLPTLPGLVPEIDSPTWQNDVIAMTNALFARARAYLSHSRRGHPQMAERILWRIDAMLHRAGLMTPELRGGLCGYRGRAFVYMADYETAIEFLNEACALSDARDHRWLRGTSFYATGRYKESHEDYGSLVSEMRKLRWTKLLSDDEQILFESGIVAHLSGASDVALETLSWLHGVQADHWGPHSIQADYSRVAMARIRIDQGEFEKAWELTQPTLEMRDSYVEMKQQNAGQIDYVLQRLLTRPGPWDQVSSLKLEPTEKYPLFLQMHAGVAMQVFEELEAKGVDTLAISDDDDARLLRSDR